MKFSVELNWAFFISIFTIFLYWCGYCYLSGMMEYYHHQIDAFDIPTPIVLMYGVLNGTKYYLNFLSIICLFVFFKEFSLNQWIRGSCKILGWLFNTIFIIFYVMYTLILKFLNLNFIKLIFEKIRPINVYLNFLYIYFCNTKPIISSINTLSSFASFNETLKIKTVIFLEKINLTTEKIQELRPLDGTEKSFDASFILHALSWIGLLCMLLFLFNIAGNLNSEGKAYSGTRFENSVKNFSRDKKDLNVSNLVYDRAEINGQNNIDFFFTDICFKNFCLLVDQNRNAQIYETKNFKVLNSVDTPPN
ncbi:hypothetical protein [Acinetobacter sp. HY1485]|uniref:hypothetical protein n=1 Tax=Acinetobacter sp. HY1485 TaxID=2970918 RepID=UPI0022B95BF6|nr:hypothetical protein [Acinetobacter sp. HY1485]